MLENNYTFDQIEFLVSRGIVPRKPVGYQPVDFAVDQGMYMGCPGKEIFYTLPTLTDSQLKSLCLSISHMFPIKTPSRGVHFSVFWRYFYGVFDKRGILNNNGVVNTSNVSTRWSLYLNFSDSVSDYYTAKFAKNHYGYVVSTEMKAHRYGDLMLLSEGKIKKQYLNLMLDTYTDVHNISSNILARKNAFSSLYWCSMYLFAAHEKQLFNSYATKFLIAANNFATSVTTKSKVVSILNRLHDTMTEKEFNKILKMYRNFDNKVMRSFGFVKLSFDKKLLGVS